MATQKELDGLQHNGNKATVRHYLVVQTLAFQKLIGKPIKALELPASEWYFTKALMQTLRGKLAKAYAVEGHSDKKVFAKVKANIPKNDKVELYPDRMDIDEFIANFAEILGVNVLWPDYCSHPAAVNLKTGEYSFPKMDTFINFIKETKRPVLYFMTFKLNATQLKFGIKGLKKALSPSAPDMSTAVIRKLTELLQKNKLMPKIRLVLHFSYMGGAKARSPMITLGYAINLPIPHSFPFVNENRLVAPKAPYQSQTNLTKQAILVLLAKNMTTSDIVSVLKVNPMQVAGLRAAQTRKVNAVKLSA